MTPALDNLPKVSVIIPSFRPGAYVIECLDSIINQTLRRDDYEVIIVLNGEKEPYLSMLKNKTACHNNIKVIYTSEPGVSNARNIGLDIARGEYITFIDDDDIVSPEYLDGLLTVSSESIMALSRIHSFQGSLNNITDNFFITQKYNNDYKNVRSKKNLVKCRSFFSYVAGRMIHRNVIGKRRFDKKIRNGEDSLFLASITDKVDRIEFSNISSVYYVRERENSANRKKFNNKELLEMYGKLLLAYTKTYLKNPLAYSFIFFFSRLISVSKSIYNLSKN